MPDETTPEHEQDPPTPLSSEAECGKEGRNPGRMPDYADLNAAQEAERNEAVATLREAIAEADPERAREHLTMMMEAMRLLRDTKDPAYLELLRGACVRVDLPARVGEKYVELLGYVPMLEEYRKDHQLYQLKGLLRVLEVLRKHGEPMRRGVLASSLAGNPGGRDFVDVMEWLTERGIVTTWQAPRAADGGPGATYHSLKY